ncbi:MAG: glutamyl-tRNA reductase [Desulfomonilia bacterium]|jgi:glutamyl-tRNA reductase
MNPIRCLSINHRIASLEIREKLLLNPGDFTDLVERGAEIYVLCTCNRTEVYWTGTDEQTLLDRLGMLSGVPVHEIRRYSELFQGREAVRHLFLVASGLDSLVIGESQILGQVKEAYRASLAAGTTALFLNKALHRAFRTAKRVRTETDIGRYPVSVASEAVELACHIFGDISKSPVLVIGAGDMASIAARRLKDRGARDLCIINRTHSTACDLASELGGRPRPFEALKEELVRCSIVITSTGSPKPIITKALMTEVMKQRRNEPMILIDIAVPRDVDPEAGSCYNCYLYDIDALKAIVDRHATSRREEADKAVEIVASEAERFDKWVDSLDAQATIRDLFNLMEDYVASEANGSSLAPEHAELLEEKLRISLKRFFHRVASYLKEHPTLQNIEHTRRIFQLDEDYQDRHKG